MKSRTLMDVLAWPMIVIFGYALLHLYLDISITPLTFGWSVGVAVLLGIYLAHLARRRERNRMAIPNTRVDESILKLPTVSQLIDEGREPEEVGEMLASGKARNG